MTDEQQGKSKRFSTGSLGIVDNAVFDFPEPAPVERNESPKWSDVMSKWSHPVLGRCTCGCNGGWSSSEKGIK